MNLIDGRRLIVTVYPNAAITLQLTVNSRRFIPLQKSVTCHGWKHALAVISHTLNTPQHRHTAISIRSAA